MPVDPAAAMCGDGRRRRSLLTIDTGRRCDLRDHRKIPLPKLSFDLLLALARAAPNVVTLQALTEKVWRNVIVGPETLSQRVKLLREALGDNSRHPRYIVSLRSRGYRFIQPVVQLPNAHPAAVSAAPQTPSASRRKPLWKLGAPCSSRRSAPCCSSLTTAHAKFLSRQQFRARPLRRKN